jgi:predicted DNA-binding transcriptional regulator AlpA
MPTIPNFVTQADLREKRISSGKAQTDYLIKHHGFPPGRMLSPQIRGWTESEIGDWLATRPLKAHCNIPAEKRGRGRPRKPQPPLQAA